MARKKSKKKSKNKSTTITSGIYSRVCKELGHSIESLMIEEYALPEKRTMSNKEVQEIKEKIHSLYCKYLLEVDTKVLEDIMTTHESGKMKRTNRVLDLVQKELLERVINEEGNST